MLNSVAIVELIALTRLLVKSAFTGKHDKVLSTGDQGKCKKSRKRPIEH